MTDHGVTESVVEDLALAWLAATGWQIARGSDFAPVQSSAERSGYRRWMRAERLMPRVDS